jgi:hypothetical protein
MASVPLTPDLLPRLAATHLGHAARVMPDELVAEVREMLGLKRTQEGTGRIQEAIQRLIQEGGVIYGVASLRLKPAVADLA